MTITDRRRWSGVQRVSMLPCFIFLTALNITSILSNSSLFGYIKCLLLHGSTVVIYFPTQVSWRITHCIFVVARVATYSSEVDMACSVRRKLFPYAGFCIATSLRQPRSARMLCQIDVVAPQKRQNQHHLSSSYRMLNVFLWTTSASCEGVQSLVA